MHIRPKRVLMTFEKAQGAAASRPPGLVDADRNSEDDDAAVRGAGRGELPPPAFLARPPSRSTSAGDGKEISRCGAARLLSCCAL